MNTYYFEYIKYSVDIVVFVVFGFWVCFVLEPNCPGAKFKVFSDKR